MADALDCGIEFGLTPAGNIDGCAFAREALGGGKADAGTAAGDQNDFAGVTACVDMTGSECIHCVLLMRCEGEHKLIPPILFYKDVFFTFFMHRCAQSRKETA